MAKKARLSSQLDWLNFVEKDKNSINELRRTASDTAETLNKIAEQIELYVECHDEMSTYKTEGSSAKHSLILAN